MRAGLVGGEGFAIDASVIEADASRGRKVDGKLTTWPEAEKVTRGMIGDCGKKNTEDDRHWPLKACRAHQREDLRFVADLCEADNRSRYEKSFHRNSTWNFRRFDSSRKSVAKVWRVGATTGRRPVF
jgi:hypothetical protein